MLKAKKKVIKRVFVRALYSSHKLELLKDRLTELPGYHSSSHPWYILFVDLLKAETGKNLYGRVRGHGQDICGLPSSLLLAFKKYKTVQLGCRTFSVVTYKKILKAARAHARKKS